MKDLTLYCYLSFSDKVNRKKVKINKVRNWNKFVTILRAYANTVGQILHVNTKGEETKNEKLLVSRGFLRFNL